MEPSIDDPLAVATNKIRNACIFVNILKRSKGRMTKVFYFNPLEIAGARHNQKVQAALAQLPSGQNKKRPPLTMEPSTDDPLAAVESIMCHTYFSVNISTGEGGATV